MHQVSLVGKWRDCAGPHDPARAGLELVAGAGRSEGADLRQELRLVRAPDALPAERGQDLTGVFRSV